MDLATIRQDVFSTISALLVANKPTYTYNGAIQTYDILAEYPQDSPTFPCLIINKGNAKDTRLTMDGATGEQFIDIQIDFYAKELHGKKAIDAGMDSVMNTILNNISTFISTNKIAPEEEFWTDSGSSTFEERNQVINTATSILKFKVI